MKAEIIAPLNNSIYRYKNKNLGLGLNITLVFIYIILKMYRNSINTMVETTGGIWNLINLFFVLLGILCVFSLINRKYRFPACINTGIVYAAGSWFVAFFHLQNLSVNSIFTYLMIPYFILVIIVFYTYGIREITKINKQLFILFFYVISAFTLYLMLNRNIYSFINIYQSDAYFILCLFPFILLWRRGLKLYIPFSFLTAILIFAGKRNGAISIIVALIFYFLVEYKLGNRFGRFFKILKRLLLISVIAGAIYFYLSNRYSIDLMERIVSLPEDGGSSRDVIYSSIWFAIKESTLYEWLFGHGINGVITVFGRTSGAHNDFLEVFYNFGFFVLILFIAFYIVLIATAVRMIKDRYYGASAFAASVVISLFMSMFSNYAITFTHVTGMAAFWGIALAEWTLMKAKQSGKYMPQKGGFE